MKHILRLVCALLFAVCALGHVSPRIPRLAAADGEQFAVADSREVWFYAGRDESSRLFLLPYTYYVRVISEEEDFVAAEYLTDDPPFRKLTGYCKREELTFVDFVPERPFLRREITFSYALPQEGGLGEGKFTSMERTFVYYGHRYEGGKLYFYVGADGEYDYIPAERELEYELNSDYLAAAEETGGHGLSAAIVVSICLGCAAAVAVAVFVVRGKKPSVETERAEF